MHTGQLTFTFGNSTLYHISLESQKTDPIYYKSFLDIFSYQVLGHVCEKDGNFWKVCQFELNYV